MITADDFESLASKLGQADFDLMLVGDGAGSLLDTPCGWFAATYERKTALISEHFGGTSGGTNNFSELETFTHSLWAYRHVLWAHHTKAYGNSGGPIPDPPRVLIVSDSEVTVKCGNREYTRRANAPLWASIEWFEGKGYVFTWKHVPRNSNALNKYADEVAKRVRRAMGAILGG